MIFQSTILALLLSSLITSLIVVWAAHFSVRVLRHWDMSRGDAAQIDMERRTYLVSTALVFVMLVELGSLILFVYNADKMAVMFTGAMCAVGTLNVNGYGFPALLFKLTSFFGAFVWLVLNDIDGKARDYPLTRFKYGLLVGFAPVFWLASALLFLYFFNLKTEVITSCCSRLFTPETSGIEAQLSSMEPQMALWLLFAGLASMTVLATIALWRPALASIYAGASVIYFIVSLVAIVSVIAPYIYAQPYHHCPFCILKPEYDFIGYGLYLSLFVATGFALPAGLVSLPLPSMQAYSIREILPKAQVVVVSLSICAYLLFGAICLYSIWSSDLILFHH